MSDVLKPLIDCDVRRYKDFEIDLSTMVMQIATVEGKNQTLQDCLLLSLSIWEWRMNRWNKRWLVNHIEAIEKWSD